MVSKAILAAHPKPGFMHARLHLLLLLLCIHHGRVMAKTPAPASTDFCATLLEAIKAAEASPEGTKSLAAGAAKTGKYYRDYFHDGSIMNASLQIGGALQTNVRKSSFGYYNLHKVMEDLEHDSDIAPKYEA